MTAMDSATTTPAVGSPLGWLSVFPAVLAGTVAHARKVFDQFQARERERLRRDTEHGLAELRVLVAGAGAKAERATSALGDVLRDDEASDNDMRRAAAAEAHRAELEARNPHHPDATRMEELAATRSAVGRVAAAAIIAVLVLLAAIVAVADGRADEIRAGKAVGPIRPFGIMILNVRAQPATLQPVEGMDPPAALTTLGQRPLLYLGQANGTVVVFAPDGGEAVYVPAGALVVRVKA